MKKHKKLIRNLTIITNLLLIVLFVLSVNQLTRSYYVGLHNIDLTHNFLLVSNDLNNYYHNDGSGSYLFNYRDMGERISVNKTKPVDDLYIETMSHMWKLPFIAVVLAMVLVVITSNLYIMLNNKDK